MAYTVDQLSTFFKNANAGTGPTAAQTLSLQALANQNAAGTLSNDQALAATVDLASDSTTGVSVGAYQFFLGYAPSEAGLASLNAAYVGTGSQASLNGESRFIAQSISLALQNPTAKANFAASYGSLSVEAATKAAYDIIIGNAAAAAAGIDVSKSIAFLTGQTAYYTAFVKQVLPGLSAEDQALAVKAAIIGEILFVATSYNNGAGIGSYATATTNLIKDLADDGHLTANNNDGVDLFTNYGPGGVGQSYTLTAGIDTLTGTSGNDTFVGNTSAGVLGLTTLDNIDGGQGNDALNLTVDGAIDTTANVSTVVKNVETINVLSTNTVKIDTSAWAGTTALNVNGAIGAVTATAAATTAIKVVAASGAGTVSVQGGSSADVTASGVTGTAAVNIGTSTAVSGNIKASVAVVAAGTAGTVTAVTKGGTSISLTETLADNTATAGALVATDSAAAAGKLGTLTTVTLDGYNGGAVNSNALTTLNLANGVGGTVTVTNSYGTGNATTTLALNLNGAAGQLTDANNVYSTININATGSDSTLTIVDTALKTVSVAGDHKVNLGTVPASVTAYTGSGTGGVAGTFGAALKTYASTATGGDTVTLNPTALTTATFGAGADTVTISGALASTTAISLGDGNDKLVLTTAPTPGVTLSGGNGTDTISVTAAVWSTIAGTFVAGDVAKITGFETLAINNSGAAATSTYNLGVLPGLANVAFETGVAAGATLSVSSLTSGQTITVGGTGTTATGFVNAIVSNAATGTADVVNFVANTAIVQNNDAVVDVTTGRFNLTAVDVETVNLKSTGTLSTAVTTGNATDVASNTFAITNTNTALTTVNITGDQAAVFTSDAAFVKLATVDASANTASVTIDVSSAAASSPIITVKGTANADTFTVGNKAIVSGNGGNDTFNVALASSGNNYSTISDANKSDKIHFATTATAFATTAVTQNSGTAVFQDYLDAATASTTGAADHNLSWFVYGGDTYVVQDNSNSTTFQNGVDSVIKLTGTTNDLSKAVLAAGVLTLG